MRAGLCSRPTLAAALLLIGIVASLPLVMGGCSNDVAGFVPVNSPPCSPELARAAIGESTAAQMLADAAPFIQTCGVNLFTTAHYGTSFLTGTVDLEDVFDARDAVNLDIFHRWANEKYPNPTDPESYYRFAHAATEFLAQFGYDAVLFRPDEYHPIFTTPGDTWLFVRDDPQISGRPYYTSARVQNRQRPIEGGMVMQPYQCRACSMYYVPVTGATYARYQAAGNPTGSGTAEPPNAYRPSPGTAEQCAARALLGIHPSPISGRRGLLVGTWKSASRVYSNWRYGFSFSGNPNQYTWGGRGLYVLPLDPTIWASPRSAMAPHSADLPHDRTDPLVVGLWL